MGARRRLVGGQLSGAHLYGTGVVEFSRSAMVNRAAHRAALLADRPEGVKRRMVWAPAKAAGS